MVSSSFTHASRMILLALSNRKNNDTAEKNGTSVCGRCRAHHPAEIAALTAQQRKGGLQPAGHCGTAVCIVDGIELAAGHIARALRPMMLVDAGGCQCQSWRSAPSRLGRDCKGCKPGTPTSASAFISASCMRSRGRQVLASADLPNTSISSRLDGSSRDG